MSKFLLEYLEEGEIVKIIQEDFSFMENTVIFKGNIAFEFVSWIFTFDYFNVTETPRLQREWQSLGFSGNNSYNLTFCVASSIQTYF